MCSVWLVWCFFVQKLIWVFFNIEIFSLLFEYPSRIPTFSHHNFSPRKKLPKILCEHILAKILWNELLNFFWHTLPFWFCHATVFILIILKYWSKLFAKQGDGYRWHPLFVQICPMNAFSIVPLHNTIVRMIKRVDSGC